MGFMAGFGEGFSRSFAQAAQNRAVKERDAFQIAYEQYINKKAAYDKDQSEWDSAMKKGQLLAEKYGLTDADALKLAEHYRAGFSDNSVEDIAANAVFTQPPQVDQASDQTMLAIPGMGDAMPQPAQPEEAPMSPTQQAPVPEAEQTQQQAQAPVQQDTGILGNMFGPDGLFKNAGMSDTQQAESQVKEQVGADQFDMVQKGFTQPNLAASTYKYTPKNADDKFILPTDQLGLETGVDPATRAKINIEALSKSSKPEDKVALEKLKSILPLLELKQKEAEGKLTPEGADALGKLLIPVKDQLEEIGNRRAGAQEYITTLIDLDKMAKDSNGMVLTGVADLASIFEGLKTEGAAALDVLQSFAGNKDVQQNDVLNAFLQSWITPGDTKEVAAAKREFGSMMIRAVYAMGKAHGQQGNGFSNADYKLFFNALQTGNGLAAFHNNLMNISSELIRSADIYAATQAQNPFVQIAMQQPELEAILTPTFEPMDSRPEYKTIIEFSQGPKMVPGQEPESLENQIGKPIDNSTNIRTYNGKQYIFTGPVTPERWKDPKNWIEYNGR